jgi:Spy/CpxP family protein refolding chaperone
MNREKLLTISVVLLLLLNLGILGFLFFSPKPHPPQGPGPQGPGERPRPGQVIVDKLQLDDNQLASFEKLKKEHRAKVNELDEQQEAAMKQYFQLLGKATVSPAQRDSLEKILGTIEISRARLTYDHFNTIKGLCRPEQAEKFNDLVPDIVGVILPAPGGKRNPPPPRRGE